MLEIKNELKDVVDIELVGIPRGLLTDPAHIDRMKEAMQMGLDYVGGTPQFEYTYEEGVESIKICMDIAERNGAGVDIHADETDDPNSRFTENIASEAIKRDLSNQVTASHCTAMHSYPNQYANKLINRLAEAGVNVITNPPDNMVLQAAYDDYPKRRGHTRVDELHAGGVTVGLGHDSVMDPIYEYGKADPLDAAYLLAHFAHMHKHRDVETLWRMLIDSNSQFFGKGREEIKLVEGNEASMVVHGATTPFEVLRTRADRRLVISKGSIVARRDPAETVVNLTDSKSVNFRRDSA
jgi:cytosine deaminase